MLHNGRNPVLKQARQCKDGILPKQPAVSIPTRKDSTGGSESGFILQTGLGSASFSMQGLPTLGTRRPNGGNTKSPPTPELDAGGQSQTSFVTSKALVSDGDGWCLYHLDNALSLTAIFQLNDHPQYAFGCGDCLLHVRFVRDLDTVASDDDHSGCQASLSSRRTRFDFVNSQTGLWQDHPLDAQVPGRVVGDVPLSQRDIRNIAADEVTVDNVCSAISRETRTVVEPPVAVCRSFETPVIGVLMTTFWSKP